MLLKHKIIIIITVVAGILAIGITLGLVRIFIVPDNVRNITINPRFGDQNELVTEKYIDDKLCKLPKTFRMRRTKKILLESDSMPIFLKNMRRIPQYKTAGTPRLSMPTFSWIIQKVDHFNPNNLNTWRMRYIKSDQFYKPGGPIFIYLGGEWEIDPSALMSGNLLHDMAKANKGYMFNTEHRYYGHSFPIGDLCLESMQYLNTEQALADVVFFIAYIKREIPSLKNSKVVVVGCSYAATIATWLRLKYPHLIDAALAFSGPILAIEDFYQFYEVVANSITSTSKECANVISEAITEIKTTLTSTDIKKGLAKISRDFKFCFPPNLTKPLEKSYFFSELYSPIVSLVQQHESRSIKKSCDIILNYPGNAYEKFKNYFNNNFEHPCIGNYDEFIDVLNYPLPKGMYRQWMFQTCTTFGFYPTTSFDNILFGKNTVNIDMFRKMCEDLYEVTPEMLKFGIERTNTFYGGLKPNITRIVSIHGSFDPYSALGLFEDLNEEAPVFVVKGGTHCCGLSSVSKNDIPQLRKIKIKIKQLIAKWIKS